jgi:hypothetical protein
MAMKISYNSCQNVQFPSWQIQFCHVTTTQRVRKCQSFPSVLFFKNNNHKNSSAEMRNFKKGGKIQTQAGGLLFNVVLWEKT